MSQFHRLQMPDLLFRCRFGFFGWAIAFVLLNSGCAYHLGRGERSLPEGARDVAIPIFKNRTMFPGAEGYFTDALREQFFTSGIANLSAPSKSEATFAGEILNIQVKPNAQAKGLGSLSDRAVLTTEYLLTVDVLVRLKRHSDQKVLWEGLVTRSTAYPGAQVTLRSVNSVNPLYNESLQEIVLADLAKAMMAEIHERVTESF